MCKQGDRVKRLICMFGFAWLAWAAGPDLDRANKLYNITEFQQSLEVLRAVPNKDAAVYELMGRNYYGQGDFRRATEALEQAAVLAPGNSTVYLWLGRAYGRRAETSSIITAPGLANKARQFFEKAAQLNPANLDAQSDLFEYYLEAPGFLGGGFDRAAATAAQIARISPSRSEGRAAKPCKSGCSERFIRVLPGGAWLPGRGFRQGCGHGRPDRTDQPVRGILGPSSTGRKAQGIRQRRSPVATGPGDRPAAGRTIDRFGAAVDQAGPLPGGRPELGEGGADRAQQPEADVCESGFVHQRQAQS